MFSVYVLRSLKDGRFYYGSTQDLSARLKAHNAGKVRSTKARRPTVLHYQENFETKHEASKRERFFKSIDGYNWLRQRGILEVKENTGELAERLLHRS